MIFLRLEHQKRNAKNNQFKNCEPEGMVCENYRDQTETVSNELGIPHRASRTFHKSCENYRAGANNGANVCILITSLG